MAWNYSGNPAASPLDEGRFYCGDVFTDNQLITDEELNFLISKRGSTIRGAQDACLMIMARLAREVDYYLGPERVHASQRLSNYQKVYEHLRALWIGMNAAPSWSDPMVAIDTNAPLFDVGMFDNHNGGGSNWMRNLKGD